MEHHVLQAEPGLPAADGQPGAVGVGARLGAVLPAQPVTLTGRSWSGAGRIAKVSVSLDGGASWQAAALDRRPPKDEGWTQWSVRWSDPRPGRHELLARATDDQGRTQPFEAAYNPQGYFFDAVVRHPVQVV